MRTANFKVVALMALLGCLLGVSGASAATNEKDLVSGFLFWLADSGGESGTAGAGSVESYRPFIKHLDAYCQSSCCWAACIGSPGGEVQCSESSCSASCPDGSKATIGDHCMQEY